MESILQSTQDHLVSNLSFKIPQNGASYVTDKQQATFFPLGSDIYNPLTGQRVIRFALSSSGYLDLSSLVFSMDFLNGPTHPATALVNGAHCLFTRCRVLISGTEVENVEYHNIAAEMFHRLLPAEKKANVELMGFAGGPSRPTQPRRSSSARACLASATSRFGSPEALWGIKAVSSSCIVRLASSSYKVAPTRARPTV
jgi:hypothetical protein